MPASAHVRPGYEALGGDAGWLSLRDAGGASPDASKLEWSAHDGQRWARQPRLRCRKPAPAERAALSLWFGAAETERGALFVLELEPGGPAALPPTRGALSRGDERRLLLISVWAASP